MLEYEEFLFANKETLRISYFNLLCTGDSVTIASSEELIDACEQYVGQKVLRITTYVKPKTTAAALSDKKSPPPSSVDRGISTSGSPSPPPIQIQDVLESFVGVLSTAVNHLQEGLAAKSSKKPVPSVAPAAAAAKQDAPAENKTPAEGAVAKKPEETDDAADKGGDSKVPAEDKKPAAEPASDEEEENSPFIHGRHTCDICLSTPIIGTRYHSTNVR